MARGHRDRLRHVAGRALFLGFTHVPISGTRGDSQALPEPPPALLDGRHLGRLRGSRRQQRAGSVELLDHAAPRADGEADRVVSRRAEAGEAAHGRHDQQGGGLHAGPLCRLHGPGRRKSIETGHIDYHTEEIKPTQDHHK